MSNPRDLLGAYALGAVESDEIPRLERLIATDPSAQREVAEHRQVVELLGAMNQTQPPEDLWARVADTIAQQEGESVVDLEERRAARASGASTRWMPQAVAAVLVIVLGFFSLVQGRRIADLNDQVTGQRTELAALEAAAADPLSLGAEFAAANAFETVNLRAESSPGIEMTIVVMEDGRAYVTSSGLVPLPEDRTYQLWAIMDDERIISAAVLGNEPGVDTFVVDLGGLVGFAVTEEIDGGVVASENPAVVVGLIDA